MAQVRKLSDGEKVPEKKNGSINYNGTASEFTDDIYASLVANLDTGAASGIIRKGLDIGRQEGNTFYYDSEYNRAFVLNSEGKKVWDYQSTIGPRKNIKVRWQGTFGRSNLAKNPNDVNRLLQSIMSGFSIPDPKDPAAPTKKKISTDKITIGIGTDKNVSPYDANYTAALNRLALLDQYYNNADTFTSEYDFDESNLWRTYLDTHKGSVYSSGEGNAPGKSIFKEVLTRVANGTYDNNDEKLLNAFNIFLSTEPAKSDGPGSGTNDSAGAGATRAGSGVSAVAGPAAAEAGTGNGNNKSNNASDLKLTNGLYLPQFYDATIMQVPFGPKNQKWVNAKTWSDEKNYHYVEFTNDSGEKYYVCTDPSKTKYLRTKTNDIYWDEATFQDFVKNKNLKLAPTDQWTVLDWMDTRELKRTTQGGSVDVIGWENLKVNGQKIPIRKSLSENPVYYARLLNGHWIQLNPGDYEELKKGNLEVLKHKKVVQFYKDGGKVLKMQNAAGGQVPVTDMTATYSAPIYQDPSERPMSGWDQMAVIGTGAGSGFHILGALGTNPKWKTVMNILSLLGYGAATVGNTVSTYQNTGQLGLGNMALSAYGLFRGFAPRPKQRFFHNNNIKVDPNASRWKRIGKGFQNYGPKLVQIADIGTGLTGSVFGAIGTANLINSIANDPNKKFWDWNTWTMGDARNFQIGMTGLSPIVAGAASKVQNIKMRKHLPASKHKFESLDEINYALLPATQKTLKRNATNYIKNNPIKEAFLGNPYTRAINTAQWNSPAPKWRASIFTTSPSAIGLTGGLMPWDVYAPPPKYIIEEVVPIQGTVQSVSPVDTLDFHGMKMFKKGGSVLKMQDAPTGKVPEYVTQYGLKDAGDLVGLYTYKFNHQNDPNFNAKAWREAKRNINQYLRLNSEQGLGAWTKSLQLEGSLMQPLLEGTKLAQSIGTTKKNSNEEIAATKKAALVQQQPSSELIQKSYDFSAETTALSQGLGQLNSSFSSFSNSTSDNNQRLSAMNSYANNTSNILNSVSNAMSNKKAAIDNFNDASRQSWNNQEAARIASNNSIMANSILKNAETKNTKRTNISKDLNTVINTTQDWLQKDAQSSNNGMLVQLEAQRKAYGDALVAGKIDSDKYVELMSETTNQYNNLGSRMFPKITRK